MQIVLSRILHMANTSFIFACFGREQFNHVRYGYITSNRVTLFRLFGNPSVQQHYTLR